MSLSRAALRLAAIAALTGGGLGPTYPTIAGARVIDSQVDPEHQIDNQNVWPSIRVHTEDDKAFARKSSGLAVGFEAHTITLLIECSVYAPQTHGANGDGLQDGSPYEYAAQYPYEALIGEASGNLEFLSDCFCEQIMRALNLGASALFANPWSNLFQKAHRGLSQIEPMQHSRFATTEQGITSIHRMISLPFMVADCPPFCGAPLQSVSTPPLPSTAQIKPPLLQEIIDKISALEDDAGNRSSLLSLATTYQSIMAATLGTLSCPPDPIALKLGFGLSNAPAAPASPMISPDTPPFPQGPYMIQGGT